MPKKFKVVPYLHPDAKEIIKLATSNTYDNEKVILDKIRDLVRDYQSNN